MSHKKVLKEDSPEDLECIEAFTLREYLWMQCNPTGARRQKSIEESS